MTASGSTDREDATRTQAPPAPGTAAAVAPLSEPQGPWSRLPDRLRARGLRWTPQRRVLVDVLSRTDGHVTGVELVDRCRELDPATTPSTVYRTLDVLEELGVLSHSHGADGREEFHVLPAEEHGHLYCRRCGGKWELATTDPAVIAAVAGFESSRGFEIELSHLSLIGRCVTCRAADAARSDPA